ncbi:unnamed protein product [Coregonus sp. 'balchen']|nr:unnamed protein product [Coregonus sp. 'balchen']
MEITHVCETPVITNQKQGGHNEAGKQLGLTEGVRGEWSGVERGEWSGVEWRGGSGVEWRGGSGVEWSGEGGVEWSGEGGVKRRGQEGENALRAKRGSCFVAVNREPGWDHSHIPRQDPWEPREFYKPPNESSRGMGERREGEWERGERGKGVVVVLLWCHSASKTDEGSSYYDNVRPLAYPDSDAVLICFDISRPETLDSVLKKWQGETQEFCPNAKVVLVGCKLDMRTDVSTLRELSKQRLIPVTHEQVSRGRGVGKDGGMKK